MRYSVYRKNGAINTMDSPTLDDAHMIGLADRSTTGGDPIVKIVNVTENKRIV